MNINVEFTWSHILVSRWRVTTIVFVQSACWKCWWVGKMHFGQPVVFACRRAVSQICAGDVMRMFGLAGIMCYVLTALWLFPKPLTPDPWPHHPPPSLHKQSICLQTLPFSHSCCSEGRRDGRWPFKGILFNFKNIPEWTAVAVEIDATTFWT